MRLCGHEGDRGRAAMGETRKQLKARLQASGAWDEYLACREQLAQTGLSPTEARKEALRQIDARPPQKPEPPTPVQTGDEPCVEAMHEPLPLCDRCERLFGQPGCPTCFQIHGTAETLRSADLPSEADWLERWIVQHQNDPPATAR